MAELTGEIQLCKQQIATEIAFLEAVWSELTMLKAASQQRKSKYVSACEKLAAERASQSIAFQEYQDVSESKVSC